MVVDIMNHQVEKHEVHLLVLNDHIDITLWDTIDRRVKLHAIGRKEGSKSYLPYIKYIATLLWIRPDIIHSHSARLISLLRFSPVKKVYTQHCSLDITSWNPTILNGYSNVMAISNFVKNSLNVRGINHVSVVYNSIDIDSIQKKESYQLSDAFSIVQVGRLFHTIKGQHLLVEAVKILVDNGKNVKLDFIGDGDSMQHLQKMVKERGLEDVVSFLGTRDRAYIYSHLCSYDMLCHPSLCEGFGLTVAEGMVAGLPVIVSENDGPSELVCEGEYGYMCKKGDVKSLADTIQTIMDNYERAIEVAQKARMYASREFSIANMVHKIEDIYIRSL